MIGRAALLLLALSVPSLARAGDPRAVLGTWWTPDKDGVVQITSCAAGLCGHVVGIGTFRPDGSAPVDLHGQSRCHLQIIPDGTANQDGVWDSHITNPDDGKTYTTTLRVAEDGRLRMRGYVGLPLFGQTVFWTRFNGRLTPDCHVRN